MGAVVDGWVPKVVLRILYFGKLDLWVNMMQFQPSCVLVIAMHMMVQVSCYKRVCVCVCEGSDSAAFLLLLGLQMLFFQGT